MSWAVKTIGELCDQSDGIVQTGPFGSQLKQSEYIEDVDGIPVVMPKDIKQGSIDESEIARISESKAKTLGRHMLAAGDIVFPRRGEISKRGYIKEAGKYFCGTGCLKIHMPDNEVLNKYLFYYLDQDHVVKWLEGRAIGSTMLNLNTSIMRSVNVNFPDLRSQERIVTTLSAYDDLIINDKRQIELLEESARQLYKEWFVRFRFPGHEHVKIVDGVPDGWKRLTVAECCAKPTYGYTASADFEPVGPKFLRITDIVPSSIDWPNVPHCLADERTTNKYLLVEGDIVVARTGATVGYAKLMPELNEEVVYASYLVRFRPVPAIIDNQILGIFVESESYKEHVRAHAGGAAQPNANAQVLGSAKLNVPPLALQTQFKDFVEPILKQKSFLEKANFALAKSRDLLLPKLMSGEIAV